MEYNQLTFQERYYIEIESEDKGARGYRHKQANRTAKNRHKIKTKSIKLPENIMQFIENELITNQSSLKQIAGRLKRVQDKANR